MPLWNESMMSGKVQVTVWTGDRSNKTSQEWWRSKNNIGGAKKKRDWRLDSVCWDRQLYRHGNAMGGRGNILAPLAQNPGKIYNIRKSA